MNKPTYAQLEQSYASLVNKYNKLIAQNRSRLLPNDIALNKLHNMQIVLNSYYKIKIPEVDVFVLAKITDLEESLFQLRKDSKCIINENTCLKDRSDRLEIELAQKTIQLDNFITEKYN